jgi:hypothetical protein
MIGDDYAEIVCETQAAREPCQSVGAPNEGLNLRDPHKSPFAADWTESRAARAPRGPRVYHSFSND